MPKRPSRENAKERKGSADLADDDKNKKKDKPKTEIIIHLESPDKDGGSSDSDTSFVPTQEEFITSLLEYINQEPEKPPKKKQRKQRQKFVEPAIQLTRK